MGSHSSGNRAWREEEISHIKPSAALNCLQSPLLFAQHFTLKVYENLRKKSKESQHSSARNRYFPPGAPSTRGAVRAQNRRSRSILVAAVYFLAQNFTPFFCENLRGGARGRRPPPARNRHSVRASPSRQHEHSSSKRCRPHRCRARAAPTRRARVGPSAGDVGDLGADPARPSAVGSCPAPPIEGARRMALDPRPQHTRSERPRRPRSQGGVGFGA